MDPFRWLESLQFHGVKPGLERITRLLRHLGNPEKRYSTVHIAGTNGKGSTAAIAASIFAEHGLKTGLYTSPHLLSVTERFRINGREVDPEELKYYLSELKKVVEGLGLTVTYFEATTAIAFWYFAERGVDVAVVECGLGGRLDATNACVPSVCVITSISRDHTEYLGRSLTEIAQEKAGIIKNAAPVVLGKMPKGPKETIVRKAEEEGSGVYAFGRDYRVRRRGGLWDYRGIRREFSALRLGLFGRHQGNNLGCALASTELFFEGLGLRLEEQRLRKALSEVSWPARFELVEVDGVRVVFDGAHNEKAVSALLEALKDASITEFILVFGASNDGGKPVKRMLKLLWPWARRVFLCEPRWARSPVRLEAWKRLLGSETEKVVFVRDPAEAFKKAISCGLPVVVTGSLYLTAEVKAALKR